MPVGGGELGAVRRPVLGGCKVGKGLRMQALAAELRSRAVLALQVHLLGCPSHCLQAATRLRNMHAAERRTAWLQH